MKQVFAALAALPACALLSACLKPAPEAARDAEPWDRPVAAVETAVPAAAPVATRAPSPAPAAARDGGAARARDATYEVASGDTLYGISQRLGVTLAVLGRANGLAAPWVIRPGQRLRVPGGASSCCSAPVADNGRPAPDAAPATAPATVTVTALETPAASREALRRADPPPATAAPPAPATPPAAAARPATAAQPATAQPATAAAPRPVAQPVALRQAPPEPAPAQRAEKGFLWPVEGPVLARFGPREGVGRNDGINIGAAAGAPVRAAGDGVVVYAGNELRGYGNLLLVRHAGGWTSAYAHNRKLLVDRGASVARGQVIAEVGRTGGVSEPQSHFELRKGADAVDPLKYLEPR